MGWQERKREIQDALRVMKGHQRKIGKKGWSGHEDGDYDRTARMKALEFGPCKICRSLIIEHGRDGKLPVVGLRCEQGYSPLDLHRPFVTKLGEVPKCDFIIPFDDEE